MPKAASPASEFPARHVLKEAIHRRLGGVLPSVLSGRDYTAHPRLPVYVGKFAYIDTLNSFGNSGGESFQRYRENLMESSR